MQSCCFFPFDQGSNESECAQEAKDLPPVHHQGEEAGAAVTICFSPASISTLPATLPAGSTAWARVGSEKQNPSNLYFWNSSQVLGRHGNHNSLKLCCWPCTKIAHCLIQIEKAPPGPRVSTTWLKLARPSAETAAGLF